MQIIVFKGGLGNQLFQYTHYQYLKQKYSNREFYAYYPSRGLTLHNGFELDNDFHVSLPESSIWVTLLAFFLHNLNKLTAIRMGFGICYADGVVYGDESSLLQDGYFQHKKFKPECFGLEFKLPISMPCGFEEIKSDILSTNAVAIHVRRTDYLKFPHIYRVLDMSDYYNKAIDIVSKNIKLPKYFIFSEDIEWCRYNFKHLDATYVTCNKGKNSYLDLYLISLCKGVILANSTFSYWGAILNQNSPIVVCPMNWGNFSASGTSLKLDSWFGI